MSIINTLTYVAYRHQWLLHQWQHLETRKTFATLFHFNPNDFLTTLPLRMTKNMLLSRSAMAPEIVLEKSKYSAKA
jgi:hypothetical protein